MECKYFSLYDLDADKNVLIGTLWNVNRFFHPLLSVRILVLIGTLWNVNIYDDIRKSECVRPF